jgi:Zn-dependent protease with chaperone function
MLFVRTLVMLAALVAPGVCAEPENLPPASARLIFHARGKPRPRVELAIRSAEAPGALRNALSEATGCALERSAFAAVRQGGLYTVQVECTNRLPMTPALMVRHVLHPERLRPVLVEAGVERLTVIVVTPAGPVTEVSPALRSRATAAGSELRADFVLTAPLSPLGWAMGYDWSWLAAHNRGFLPVLDAFLLLLLWLRLAPGRPGWPAEVKFWGTAAIAAGCFALSWSCGVYDLLYFLRHAPVAGAARIYVVSGLAVLILACSIAAVASRDATEGLLGPHCRKRYWNSVAGLAIVIMLTPLVDAAFVSADWAARVAFYVALIAGAASAFHGPLRRRLAAIPTGPLLDRALELAQKAGLPPTVRFALELERSSGAYRRPARGDDAATVIVPASFLRSLRRDEMDACVAHALIHSKESTSRRGLFLALMLLLGAFVLLPDPALALYFALTPLALAVWVRFDARYSEHEAGCRALTLLGGAEPLIRALARLSRSQYGAVPSAIARRAHDLGALGALPPERVDELLADPGPAPAGERYDLDTLLHDAEDYLFSEARKKRARLRQQVICLAAVFFPAGLLLKLASLPGVVPSTGLGLYAVAVALAFAAAFFGEDILSLWPLPHVRSELAARLLREGIDPAASGAYFAGLAPHERPALYGGWPEWDAGYLFLSRDLLCYVGAQTRFRVARTEVEAIQLVPTRRNWWTRREALVKLRGGRAFRFTPLNVTASSQDAAEGRRLVEMLMQWHSGLIDTPTPGPWSATLEAPSWGAVPHASARHELRWVPLQALFVVALAALTGYLFGLPFSPHAAGSALHLALLASGPVLMHLAPLSRGGGA